MPALSQSTIGTVIRNAVHANLATLTEFAIRCSDHCGTYAPSRLWKVSRVPDGSLSLVHAEDGPRFDLCLGMGGEIANSFTALYEVAYFFECAFLAAVATCYVKRIAGRINALDCSIAKSWTAAVLRDVSAGDWEYFLRKPAAAVISSLDADIIPVRYGKHQLWGIPTELEKVRCNNIATSSLGGPPSVHSLDGVYWTNEDKMIAEKAIRSSPSLNHAKALQLYQSIEPIAAELGIDLGSYPLLFNYVPKPELLSLGQQHEFMRILDEVHSVDERLKLRAITGRTDPWMLSFSCPQCGQASKRVIQTKLRPDGRTIEIRCKAKQHFYQNERGDTFVQSGCGAKTVRMLDHGTDAVYRFIVENDITLYYPIKQLLAVLRSSHDTPVALPATDVGLVTASGGFRLDSSRPRGFGDHLEMLTSCMAVQYAYLQGLFCPASSSRAHEQRELVRYPMMLLAYSGRSPLSDPDVHAAADGRPVNDTSALKSVKAGRPVIELFADSLHMVILNLETLLTLRTIATNSWGEVERQLSKMQALKRN